LDQVRDHVEAEAPRERAKEHSDRVLTTIRQDLEASEWYSEAWLQEIFTHIPNSFAQACERWKGLYISALRQAQNQGKIIRDVARSAADKQQAKRLRRDAESQLELLTENKHLIQSDFYSYRYFASEGFLPGYSFPRLPLSAYIPGRRFHGGRDEFLSRPRFLAISEFGPRSIVYHEGSHYIINQVILPVRDEEELQTGSAKICPACGYLHPGTGGQGPDLCEMCGQPLGAPLGQLFRLQNVVTKRRDRINCDEENRLRLGYELKTVVRFAERGGERSYRTATVEHNGETLAKLSYGNAATIWRINLGRARRKEQEKIGFLLDVERGYWARHSEETGNDSDPMSPRTEWVVPYVEDRRNCLIFELADSSDNAVKASLQAALKHAIQAIYELEDNELATEALPNSDDRRSILFYEAAEGGAGVLRRVLDDSKALPLIAQKALALCHFDPKSGQDLHHSEFSSENCEAACYDCLMSYSNQRDHELMDRQLVRDILLKIASANIEVSPAAVPRATHLARLMRLAGSQLEKNWLQFLEDHNYGLPSGAQQFFETCKTRPDFLYKDRQVAVYIDGPPHDYPERSQRDKEKRDCMGDRGWTVIRFGHNDDWQKIIAEHPNIFGDGS
ncbi:MAG: DUF1998 domain-containing protein, partial [Desulfobacteraceae bacterium]|nr:DUF1998 domain-containing protein [Desulfobacteraceae bacterium]